MRNSELIRMLVKHPPDAVVFGFDAKVGGYRKITGCVSGPDPEIDFGGNRNGPTGFGTIYRIELQVDDPF